jgi:hypothetical protein
VHQGDCNEYDSNYVQHLYKKQQLKVYFGVEDCYTGPTIESAITEEGDRKFKELLRSNSRGNTEYFTNPARSTSTTGLSDARDVPRLYKELQWLTYVEALTGEDNLDNRIIMYNWLNESHNDDHPYYNFVKNGIFRYFKAIQELLRSNRNDYFWRKKVKALSK